MGGLCVLLLSAVVAAIYYFFIAVLAAIIFYTLVSYVLESFAAMRMGENTEIGRFASRFGHRQKENRPKEIFLV